MIEVLNLKKTFNTNEKEFNAVDDVSFKVDKGEIYGIWYLGGKSDSNFMHMTFEKGIPTDKDIGDIRVSAVSYITDELWPTTLP